MQKAYEKCAIGQFDPKQMLELIPAQNGGYVLRAPNARREENSIVGSYTSAEDLIEALSAVLLEH
ncbi:hypothetical protein [Roseobacter sp. TSBP12]|uniref:hypothetical protein n=1 Tax=Roseobacter sp. TSBP12 TaxID=1236613 RepID=UPI00125FFC0A|nr:hypothetical protein [Roseobacter sp. TSBP12]KAB6717729.1 hypothetical protein C8029_04205 [Roseobacter sp. TSBP12]